MKKILLTKFGSHLYGTNTENSDTDFKGIFLPNKEDIYLGKIKKSIHGNTKSHNDKNTKDDIDTEIYSLHYFIDLACQGQTVALDMLHATPDMIVEKNFIWDEIIKYRNKFYTKNLNAFIDYAQRQAAKYGIKGSRINSCKYILDLIDENKITLKALLQIWSLIDEDEHIKKITNEYGNFIIICGKQFQDSCGLDYIYASIYKYYENYGARAILAGENKGIDWKAVSHAFRACYQLKQLYNDGIIVFPLKEKDFLKEIKLGQCNYQNYIAPMLENLILEVKELAERSLLPEKCDKSFWNKFIIEVIENEYRK